MKIKQKFFNLIMPFIHLYWRIRKPKTYGVKILIKHPKEKDKILLTLHTYGNKTLWNIISGGYNPKKESAIEAAKREVYEEIGVDVLDLVEIGEYKTSTEGKQDTVIIFSGKIEDINTLSLSQELDKIMWQNYKIAYDWSDVAKVAKQAINQSYQNIT